MDIQGFAHEHFEQRPRESLVRGMLSAMETVPFEEGLTAESRAVRRLTLNRVARVWLRQDLLPTLFRGLRGDPSVRRSWLEVLSFLPTWNAEDLVSAICENLQHDDPNVQALAARTVCYRYPNHADEVLPLLNSPKGFAIAEELCLSDSGDVLASLLEFYPNTASPFPPVLGFLLTPERLVNEIEISPPALNQLIEEFGYAEPSVTEAQRNLIAEGFWFVSQRMTQAEPKQLRQRLTEFRWMLLPETLGMISSSPQWLDPSDSLDCDLFLAAIRESDRDNLEIWKSRTPYPTDTGRYRRVVACLHAPIRYARQIVFEEGRRLADSLSVSSSSLGQFLTERARVLLEMDEFRRVEAESLLETRWSAIHKLGEDTKDEVTWKTWPVETDADFPLAKRAVIKPVPPIPGRNGLSPGAWSIGNLADCWEENEVREMLRKLEAAYSSFLVPIGIELQIPLVDHRVHFAWRQALRYLGIPSPRRPENLWMGEAAFRPAGSFHSPILGTILLRKLGLIQSAQDVCLHISIQGDLGERVRGLMVPQLFMHLPASRQGAPLARMSRVMSKGLAHLNSDVELCREDQPASCRTELRVFAVIAQQIKNRLQLKPHFVDDIISTQILASAMLSPRQEFQWLAEQYESELEQLLNRLPRPFQDLYRSNFYEATGDADEISLLKHVPIVARRQQIKSLMSNPDFAQELETCFEELVTRHTRIIHDRFLASKTREMDFSGFAKSRSGVPFFLPAGLEDALAAIS